MSRVAKDVPMHHPSYEELLARHDAPQGSAWGLFGARDRVGAVNNADAHGILNATNSVTRGEAFGLDYPLDAFDPPIAPSRRRPEQEVFSRHSSHRDDFLKIYPQASSQIDGLSHRSHEVYGFYNGLSDSQVDDEKVLGVSAWANNGIVGRGVLLDIERLGKEYDLPGHDEGQVLSLDMLKEACRICNVSLKPGDFLLIHSGWAAWYLNQTEIAKESVRNRRVFSGIDQDRDILEWFWNERLAGLFSDTYAFEALPPREDSEFGQALDGGMMHQEMIAMLGFPIGELWRLEHLAHACRQDGRYTFLLVSKPIYMPGGVGSPCNAVAIR